jgi:choline-sulfatase
MASFSQPHDPWEVLAEHWNRYEGVEIDAPAIGHIADASLDPHSHRIREMCGGLGLDVPDDVVLNARRAHYASISYIDDKVGQLVGALEAVGLHDDTVVIFMADHGESLGERGLWYKMTFFEPSVTVPLIVHAPRHFAPRRAGANVSLLDLVPTLVDLASGKPPDGLEGESMVRLLGGGATNDRVIASEYLAEGAVAPIVMVKRGTTKLIASPSDPDQVFDLDADAHEVTNLAGSPAHAADVSDLHAEVAARWDLDALNDEVLSSQRRRRVVAEALAVGEPPRWDFEADGGAPGPYVRGSDFWAPFKRARLRRTSPRGS